MKLILAATLEPKLRNKMNLDNYFKNTLTDIDRTANDTVIEFINVYNKWAKDCHNLVKADRSQLDEIAKIDSEPRKILQRIYNKYCTSKNRQYHRTSVGYFFYGRTYNTSTEIVNSINLTKNKIEIHTAKIKNISTSKKYIVVKQGQIWKIDSVESLEGNNRWTFDIL